MKKVTVSLLGVLALILSSCSGDNLYEFEELSQKEDYIIELIVQSKDVEESVDFTAEFHETDGYGEIINDRRTFLGIGEFQVLNSAVKEYEKVGITFTPGLNIAAFQIRIFNLKEGYTVMLYYSEEIDEEVTIYYDFSTEEETILKN